MDIAKLKEGSVELSKIYPISIKSSIKRSFLFIALFIFSLVLLLTLHYENIEGTAHTIVRYATLAFSVILFVKFSYEELYRLSYCYGIENGHLVITKGIVLKKRATYPLPRISDVYLDNTFVDFIFGLCNLHVTTQTAESSAFANIEGLSQTVAIGLQERLAAFIDAAHAPQSSTEQQ